MNNRADRRGPLGYMNQMRNKDLRSVVLPITIGQFISSLAFSISAFREISTDNSQQQKRLATLSIVVGSLYIGAAAIFLFGAFAAFSRRLALIRIFSFLSAGAAALIIASAFMRTIVHFMLKNPLISECTALATGQNVVTVWGVWNSQSGHRLTPTEAIQFCKNAWDHDSFSEILWLIVDIILLPLFALIAFAYARQASAAVGGQERGRSIPTTYNPAYAAASDSSSALPEVTYNQPRYAPPSDSPPPFDKSLPAYGLPAYGAGGMDKKDNESMRTAVEDDPFSDYEELPRFK